MISSSNPEARENMTDESHGPAARPAVSQAPISCRAPRWPALPPLCRPPVPRPLPRQGRPRTRAHSRDLLREEGSERKRIQLCPTSMEVTGRATSPRSRRRSGPWARPACRFRFWDWAAITWARSPDSNEVNEMVAKALDHGINFFDNAWEYHEGMSEERVGAALKGKRDQAIVMTKVCTHGRKKDVAMRMLEESLQPLADRSSGCVASARSHLLQRSRNCLSTDGVLEALTAAKQQGKVRFVGFTGHKNPSIHLDMLNRGFAFDTVQMPINPFDPSYRSFERDVLPVAVKREWRFSR